MPVPNSIDTLSVSLDGELRRFVETLGSDKREVAAETLKAMLARGWKIEAPLGTPVTGPQSAPPLSLPLPEASGEFHPDLDLEQYWKLSKQANSIGESLVACSYAEQGLM